MKKQQIANLVNDLGKNMGGYGSTRWGWHTKKHTVECCRTISVFDLNREGILEQGAWRSGGWTWSNAHTGERTASIGYEFNASDRSWFFRVYYTITGWDGDKQDFDYRIPLETTDCNLGGIRWWFICPLSVNGRVCRRRVAKLYLPPGGRHFGCRHCHDLTYCSSQESDKRVTALRELGPLAILNGVNSGDIDLLIGLKALPDDVWHR